MPDFTCPRCGYKTSHLSHYKAHLNKKKICEGSVSLAEEYKKVSDELACHYFDCSSVTTTSVVDGIHLDKNQHHIVGAALSKIARRLLD